MRRILLRPLLLGHTGARARYRSLGSGSRAPLVIFSDLPEIKKKIEFHTYYGMSFWN